MLKQLLIELGKVLTIINRAIPKKGNRIMFFSDLGFRDNVKALYDYVIQQGINEDYEIVVASNDFKDLPKVAHVKRMGCIRGLWYFLRSKYFFYCFGRYPIMPSDKQIVINLWHGMPFKKIGNLETGKENNKYDYFSYVLSTSPIFDGLMARAFNCGEDRVLHIGQPRTDALFSHDDDAIFTSYKKKIIWMPTFRVSDILHESNTTNEGNLLPLISGQDDFDYLNTMLRDNGSLLLIKLHPIQRTQGFSINNMSNILFIDDAYIQDLGLDLYAFLRNTDALITDYSSVYIDYLLLDRPMVFTIDDIDEYEGQRGITFEDPLSMMPGPHVDNIHALVKELDNIVNDIDDYGELREKVNRELNLYVTSNSSKQLMDFCNIG